MKNIKVQNSRTSKSGKSTNFNFKSVWYSINKSIIGSIEIEGKTINISKHEKAGH